MNFRKILVFFTLAAALVCSANGCNNSTGETASSLNSVPYPVTTDEHGTIKDNGIELFISQHLLENIKPIAINLIAQYVPVEIQNGQRLITIALPGVSLDNSSDLGIQLAIRDGCMGDDALSDAVAQADCNADGLTPTHRSTVSINLEKLEQAISLKFDHAADGQGLGLELAIDNMPISIDAAFLIDLGEMLGLSGTCHVHDKINSDGSTDAAVNINHIGLKVSASSVPTMDGHSLQILMEKAEIILTGEEDSLLNMQVSPCDGSVTSCVDPFCEEHDCSDLCQTADILTQVLGNLSAFLENILSGLVDQLIAQYVTPIFSQVGTMLPLPVETAFNLGTALGALNSQFTDLFLAVDMAAGGITPVDTLPSQSAAIALDFGLTSPTASCMLPLGPAPELPLQPAPIDFSGYLVDAKNHSAQPYELALALSETNLAQAFWSLLNGGIACLSISSDSITRLTGGQFSLTSGVLSIFIPEMSTMAADNSPLYLEVSPKAWPSLTLGNMDAGENLLTLHIPSLALSIYMLADNRPVRIVELELTINAGLSVFRTSTGLSVVIDKIDFASIKQTFNQLFPGSDISELLPTILDSVGGAYLSGITIPVDLESTLNSLLGSFGIKAAISGLGTEPAESIPGHGHWLTVYASASAADNSNAQKANLTRKIVKQELQLKDHGFGETVTLTIPHQAKNVIYRVGNLPWHKAIPGKNSQTWQLPFAASHVEGVHAVEVLTYNHDDMSSLPTPTDHYMATYQVTEKEVPIVDSANEVTDNSTKSGCNSFNSTPSLWFIAMLIMYVLIKKSKKFGLLTLLVMPLISNCAEQQEKEEPAPVSEKAPEINYAVWTTSSTALTPPVITAGASTTVHCAAQSNAPIGDIQWQILLDGVEQDCAGEQCQLILTKAGRFTISCKAKGVDASSANLTVNPGEPTVITTTLSPSTVTAADYSKVNCSSQDSYGNEIYLSSYTIDAASDVIQNKSEKKVTALRTGQYPITCKSGSISASPATLTVTAGQPAAISTIVEPSTIVAGSDGATLGCLVKDKAGNILPGYQCSFIYKTNDEAQEQSIRLEDNKLSSEKVGQIMVFAYLEGTIGDNSPAVVTVTPDIAVAMDCPVDMLGCFSHNKPLNVSCSLKDRFDNPIASDSIHYTISQINSDGTTSEIDATMANSPVTFDLLGRPLFTADGHFNVIVSPASYDNDGNLIINDTLQHSLEVIVDNTPPTLKTSPASGSVLLRGTDTTQKMSVSATATEELSSPGSLFFEGQSLALVNGKSTTATASVSSRFGLNLLNAEVVDACGNSRNQISSYLRAQSTYKATTNVDSSAHVIDGLGLVLSQELLDDGNRGNGEDLESYDDIASIIENMIGKQLGELLNTTLDNMSDPYNRNGCNPSAADDWPMYGWISPRGACESKKCTVGSTVTAPNNSSSAGIRKTGVMSMDPFKVNTVTIREGGLHLKASVGTDDSKASVTLPLMVYYDTMTCAVFLVPIHIALGGTVTLDSLTIDADIDITSINGEPHVTISDLKIGLDGLDIAIDSSNSVINAVLSFISDAITSLFTNTISTQISNAFKEQIPPLLEDFLGNFSIGTSFDLPAPLNVSLALDTNMSTIAFYNHEGVAPHGIIAFGTQLYPNTVGVSQTNIGALKHSANPPTEVGINDGMAIRLKDDFLNQMLWALWYGGALNLDLGGLIADSGMEGMEIKMKAELPPVIMPSENVPGEIELGLGNLLLDAKFDLAKLTGQEGLPPLEATLYANVFLPGKLAVADGAFAFAISNSKEVTIATDVIAVNGDMSNLEQFSTLIDRVLAKILPSLLSSILTSIPIPGIDLSSLGLAGIPEGTMLSIDLQNLTRPGEVSTRISGSIAITHE